MKRPESRYEYMVAIIVICVITAAAILIIDFQIKGAILEMTQEFYKVRANDREAKQSARTDNDSPSVGRRHGGVVHSGDAGLAKGDTNTSGARVRKAPQSRKPVSGEQRNSEIPAGNSDVGGEKCQ